LLSTTFISASVSPKATHTYYDLTPELIAIIDVTISIAPQFKVSPGCTPFWYAKFTNAAFLSVNF